MFREIAGSIPDGARTLFSQHPSVLALALEVAWKHRIQSQNDGVSLPPLGHPARRSDIDYQLPDFILDRIEAIITPPSGTDIPEGTVLGNAESKKDCRNVLWCHLIYAYMIENTKIYEIFRKVLYEFLYGEKLGVPTPAAQQWLRVTEELFFRDPLNYMISGIASHIRPDMRATRRNAYWRMFGMDLTHGNDDGQPYPYVKANAYNNEFVGVFEEFLREVWIAITNLATTSGANPTDRSKIGNLAQTLQNMLMSRRMHGNLSREEFVSVSMMSWFHLTVQDNFPIINDLRADASSPEQRLFKIAQAVNVSAHGLTKSFFDIADPISRILILIETGGLNTLPAASVPPVPPFAPNVQADLNTIITHWSIITGHDMKAGKVAVK